MWELGCEESWVLKNWCFWTVVLEKTLESPLDCKEIQPVHPKGNQSWIFIGRTNAEAETPILWPPDAKNWLIGKDPDAGRDWRQEEKGTTEDEMVGWHHWLNGHVFGWTPGVGDGQGGLVCCGSWGHKESDTTEQLNWTMFQKFSNLEHDWKKERSKSNVMSVCSQGSQKIIRSQGSQEIDNLWKNKTDTMQPNVIRALLLITQVTFNNCFTYIWHKTMCVRACSVVSNSATPWTTARQALLSTGFLRQEHCSRLSCPPTGDLPNPGIKPMSLASPALVGGFFTSWATREPQRQDYKGIKIKKKLYWNGKDIFKQFSI